MSASPSAMPPVFLGSHPALDFLNTAMTPEGRPAELLGDGPAFVDWLVAAGMLDADVAQKAKRRFGTAALDAAATAARQLRGWARDWVERWRVAPTADYAVETRRLNAFLAHSRAYPRLERADDGFRLAERAPVECADDLVALVVPRIASLFVDEDPALVRRCAGHDCVLLFVDRTKAHRRLFCSAAACGNRAKVAAYRARHAARHRGA